MISTQSTVVVSDQHIYTDLGDEAVVLSLKNGVYYGLDPMAKHIWTLIQKPQQVQHIVNQLLDEYDVDVSRCQQEVISFLQTLSTYELVEVRNIDSDKEPQ